MSLEYPCVHHKSGYCYFDPDQPDACVFGPCENETPSNADRIRAMSDEELALFWAERYASAVFLEKEETGIKLNTVQKQLLIGDLYRSVIRYLKEPPKEETP